MGRIGASLESIDTQSTPLQLQLGRLVRQFVCGFNPWARTAAMWALTPTSLLTGV